jgi:segregation and condensation protein B
MEVLAIVAYNQPVTRSFVDQIRGVDSSYAMNSLIDKALIEACGRLDAPGRPMLYMTTEKFLRVFGLSSLSELPATEIMLPQKEETPVVIDGNLSDDEGGVVDPVEAAQNE